MTSNKTSFWKFICNTNIEIPIIQRDYAQGRIGEEHLRQNFLSDLKKALDSKKSLKLDFVYGSVDKLKMQPLDGQQRLTTLWLLHWYIALRVNKLEEACQKLKNFSYETRISSREFFKNLCLPAHFERFYINPNTSIVEFITCQTWFPAAWKQDPTIQALLRMLSGTKLNDKHGEDITDGLEELFQDTTPEDFEDYWNILTSEDAPIVFYQLPLDHFGLSDDLYIKMNARGKQLTMFENFKADLIGYIREQAQDNEEWKSLLDIKTGIPISLDTTWMDFFWKNRSVNNRVDEIYYAFLNRLFWNELFILKDENGTYLLKVGEGESKNKVRTNTIEDDNPSYSYLNKDKQNKYNSLSPYQYEPNGTIPIGFFYTLKTILDNLIGYGNEIPRLKWIEDFEFIPIYLNSGNSTKETSISTITQTQRILFFAVCKYFKEGKGDTTSLTRWLRIVRNLILGESEDGRPQIRSTPAVRAAIDYLGRLNSHDVFTSLQQQDIIENPTDFERRWNEEIEKAKQIWFNGNVREYNGLLRREDGSDYKTWEEIICDAEDWAFFKGAIRFLFHADDGHADWDKFDVKWQNAQSYFKKETTENTPALTTEYNNANLLKALISRFTAQNFWDVLWWKHRTFNNLPRTWLYYLLNKNIEKPVHEILCGDVEIKPLSPSSDPTKNYLYQISNTSILDYIVSTGDPRYWIRNNYHEHTAIYPSSEGIFLDAEDRDKFLLNTEDVVIDKNIVIGNKEFLLGSDISFTYKEHNYQWYRNGVIYLMSRHNPWEYAVRNKDEQQEEKHYYCLCYSKGMDLKQELERLFKEANE